MAVYIFATIVPRPEHFEAARDALRRLVPQTRAEAGCRWFTLHEGEEGRSLHLYESFESQEDLDEHYAQPYTKAVFDAYEDWLVEPVAVQRLAPPWEPA